MSDTMINKTAERIGITDEAVIKQANEFKQLLSLQTQKENGEQVESVFCLDISAGLNFCTFDQAQCMKLTNQGKMKYLRNKNLIKKMLNIQNRLNIKDLCVKLNLDNNVQNVAKILLQKYKELTNIDTSLPQYTAMTVFQACKELNISVKNKDFIDCSDLTTKKWNEFEQIWNKLGLTVPNSDHQDVNKKSISQIISESNDDNINAKDLQNVGESSIENYSDWRKRILAKAYKDLEEKSKTTKVKK